MMDDALAQADAFFDPAKQHSSGARRPLGHSVTATRAARAVRGAALLAGAAAGGMAAVAGWALLLSLLAARTLAPPAASLARPLYFDYTATPAVAEATFLGEGVAAAAAAFGRIGGGGDNSNSASRRPSSSGGDDDTDAGGRAPQARRGATQPPAVLPSTPPPATHPTPCVLPGVAPRRAALQVATTALRLRGRGPPPRAPSRSRLPTAAAHALR